MNDEEAEAVSHFFAVSEQDKLSDLHVLEDCVVPECPARLPGGTCISMKPNVMGHWPDTCTDIQAWGKGVFMRRFLFVFILVALGISFSGCATRHYVKNQIETIEPQIVEIRYTQSEQAERIDQTDRLAKTALAAADQAEMAAMVVNEIAAAAARKAMDAERRADTAQVNALRALNRIDTVEMAIEDRIAGLDKYRMAEQKTITFGFDSDVLSKEAISRLDDLAGIISGADTGYLIELQGFTDNTGTEKYNVALSERRASSVLRYLVSSGIPLHRISIVGLGKSNPVAENKTAGGREQNRRVEVRVFRANMVATATR